MHAVVLSVFCVWCVLFSFWASRQVPIVPSGLVQVLHPMFLRPQGRLAFLPLMLTSVVCACGLLIVWAQSSLRLTLAAWRGVEAEATTCGVHSGQKRKVH